jgi:hypothetical protein
MFKQTKMKAVALLLTASVLCSSCGVIFGGSRYNARIVAKDRPNAEIYANGEKIGTGTANGTFYRNKPLKVEVREAGCETTTKEFDKVFRTGNFILSVITWGLFSLIDVGTGASYKPDSKHNPAVHQNNTKDFTFTVESGCKK